VSCKIKVLIILEATLVGTRKYVLDLLKNIDKSKIEITFVYSLLRSNTQFVKLLEEICEIKKLFLSEDKFHFIILSAIASICLILSRLIYQKYVNSSQNSNKGKNDSNYFGFAKKVNFQLGFSGLFMPMILICSITSNMFIIPLFYSAYHTIGLIVLVITYFYKIERNHDIY